MGLGEGSGAMAVSDHGGKDEGNLGASVVGDGLAEARQRRNVVGQVRVAMGGGARVRIGSGCGGGLDSGVAREVM